MPWSQTSPLDLNPPFIAAYRRDRLSVTELYGVSRQTGYTWIDPYLRHGPLVPSPRAHTMPNRDGAVADGIGHG
jgi:hypothetical protein